VNTNQLPPAVTNRIDFARDIKPILDQSCLKCHGPEKPKSRFRVDSREAVLKGGDNGVAVIPGESAKSPLIHYVARLVEDMEMPPAGKGDPLTPEQIGLLRAWIDQGVDWNVAAPAAAEEFSLRPAFGWFSVHGDSKKFREHQWFREGWYGGLQDFELKEPVDERTRWTITGRALRDDYQVSLSLERRDIGFARVGYEKYRKYFADSGGFYRPFTPPQFSLNEDLHLDISRFWAEAGLTLSAWPEMVVGYEYHERDGDKSTLQWFPEGPPGADTRNIFPAAKEVDEHRHLIRFDLRHELYGVLVEDNFRYEFYGLDTFRTGLTESLPFRDPITRVNEGHDHEQAANAFRLEKQIKDWWLVSGGYLYTHLDGDASFDMDTVNSMGQLDVGNFWFAHEILLEQTSHTFNFNTQLGPWQGLLLSVGFQSEWAHQEGFGDVGLDDGDDADPSTFEPAVLRADLDRFSTDENVGLRYTRIPFTVLWAEGRFTQEELGQFEEQAGGGHHEFLRDTDATKDWREYRAGFTVSPWRWVSLNAHYKYADRRNDYDDQRDELVGLFSGNGYSAFIRERNITGDEVEAKLVLRPNTWLKTSLSYKWVARDYETVTDPTVAPGRFVTPGGRILAGDYDAHVYSLNAVFTPLRRVYLSTTFAYQNSRMATADNGNASVAPYRGDTYSVLASASFILSDKTDLRVSYGFSKADYDQDNESAGLPLGIVYERHALVAGITRRFLKSVSAGLNYAYYFYDEPSSGGFNDYKAHGVFATLAMKWP
jgi:hypothetical protein